MAGKNIEGSVALVTGANRGIGRAIAEALLASGATKVYAGTRRVDAVADLVAEYGDRVQPLQLDVTNSDQIAIAAAAASDVDILVNNAGVAAHGDSHFEDPAWIEAGRQEVDVNVFGTLELTQAFAPVLKANGGGAVVNIVSVAGLVSFPLFLSYSISKAGLHSLTQATRLFLGAQGTQVVGVYPGPVDTDMAADVPFDKVSPASVATRILNAVEAGEEDVFPDPMAEGMGGQYFADPKELERQVGGMAAQEA